MKRGIGNIRAVAGGIVAKMGTIMPMVRNYARNTADTCIQIAKGLEHAGITGRFMTVVAASPQGAGTHSLNRYPSPYGRLCAFLHRPPFFLHKSTGYVDKRGFAGIGESVTHDFDRGCGIALNGARGRCKTERVIAGCSFLSYFYYRFWRFLPLLPVVIPCWNRALSAVARVLARRLCWTGMLQRGPLSARLAMSPIVRPIPTAATDATRLIRVFSTKFRPSAALSYAGPGAVPCAGPYC